MLKCPACGRSGGPFRLRHQIQADSQLLRSWSCPCGNVFHASGGAERLAGLQAPYTGFMAEWNGRSLPVRLEHINKHETLWNFGSWTIKVAGPPNGPGTRFVSLLDADEAILAEWRLEPGWGPAEVTRRLRVRPVPEGVEPELMARVIVRLLV
jgi:hypothetical protein